MSRTLMPWNDFSTTASDCLEPAQLKSGTALRALAWKAFDIPDAPDHARPDGILAHGAAVVPKSGRGPTDLADDRSELRSH